MHFLLLLLALQSSPGTSDAAAKYTVALSWRLSVAASPKNQQVWRSKGCTGSYVKRATVSNTTVTYDDPALAGETYCYYVTVTNDDHEVSGPSDVATAVIP